VRAFRGQGSGRGRVFGDVDFEELAPLEPKQALIDKLVATDRFKEDDANWLESYSDRHLEMLLASCCERSVPRMPGIEGGRNFKASSAGCRDACAAEDWIDWEVSHPSSWPGSR
jgi:hypothetical protein